MFRSKVTNYLDFDCDFLLELEDLEAAAQDREDHEHNVLRLTFIELMRNPKYNRAIMAILHVYLIIMITIITLLDYSDNKDTRI